MDPWLPCTRGQGVQEERVYLGLFPQEAEHPGLGAEEPGSLLSPSYAHSSMKGQPYG
jgi:hypothetical protein